MDKNKDNNISKRAEYEIRKAICQAKKDKNFNTTWEKLNIKNFNMYYDDRHIRREFERDQGQSPYDFYRDVMYRAILRRMIKDGYDWAQLGKKEEAYGIKKLRLKMESYYGRDLEYLIEEETYKMLNEIEIRTALQNHPAVECVYYDEDFEKWYLKFYSGALAPYLLYFFQPIQIPVGFLDSFMRLDSGEKALFLISHGKMREGEMVGESTIAFDESEFAQKIEDLETYNFEHPVEREGLIWFFHIFSEEERKQLRDCFLNLEDVLLDYLSVYVFKNPIHNKSYMLYELLKGLRDKTKEENEKRDIADKIVGLVEEGYLCIESLETANDCLGALMKDKNGDV